MTERHMPRTAVTGATGFVGAHLCRALANHGYPVKRLSRRREENVEPVDYLNHHGLAKALNGIDVLYHVAGRINGTSEQLVEANFVTTRAVLDAASEAGVKRFIFISSAAAAMLKGEYGKIKYESEQLVKVSALEHLIFRPTLIYGWGDDKNLASMISLVRRSPVIPVLGGGKFKVQPVYIDDAINVFVQAAEIDIARTIYNVAGPEQVSLIEMLRLIALYLGKRRIYIPLPLKPIQSGLKIYARIFPRTRLPVKQVMELDKHEMFDISMTVRDFDYTPRSFEEGIKKMLTSGDHVRN